MGKAIKTILSRMTSWNLQVRLGALIAPLVLR